MPSILGCPAPPDPNPTKLAVETGRSPGPGNLTRSWSELGSGEGFQRARKNLRAEHHLLRGDALEAIQVNGWAKNLEGAEVEGLFRIVRKDPERNRSWAIILLLETRFGEALPLAAQLLRAARSPGTTLRLHRALNRLRAEHRQQLQTLAETDPAPATRRLARRCLDGPLPEK